MSGVLIVENLSVSYENALILSNICLDVCEGECVAVVGPNGAGKTTLLRAIAGLLTWEHIKGLKRVIVTGKVIYKGQDISNWLPRDRLKAGILLCPQEGKVFGSLTVHENLRMGQLAGCEIHGDTHRLKEGYQETYALFPVLQKRKTQMGFFLSGGERAMLAMARSIIAGPEVLLIDEPSLGIAPLVKREITRFLCKLKEKGTTLVLVEQDVALALKVADRVYVLSEGMKKWQGSVSEFMRCPEHFAMYVGERQLVELRQSPLTLEEAAKKEV